MIDRVAAPMARRTRRDAPEQHEPAARPCLRYFFTSRRCAADSQLYNILMTNEETLSTIQNPARTSTGGIFPYHTIARWLVKAPNNLPLTLVPGRQAPKLEGESAYHTTLSGKTIVHHPGAYKWRTLYHPSTLRVVVGRDWEPQR